jgi:hypothetical protein
VFEVTETNKAILAAAETSVKLLEAANKHLVAPTPASKEDLPAHSLVCRHECMPRALLCSARACG